MDEHIEQLRRAARILGALTMEEQAEWSSQFAALARGDYKAASASMDRIQELVHKAEREGRWTDVNHLALIDLAHDVARAGDVLAFATGIRLS